MEKKSINYILRFDDLCPTMNWEIWDRIEKLLNKYKINPIIAVIPDNHDKTLVFNEKRGDFWEHIRNYQERGWMIALHGFEHVYTNNSSGLMGISANSEFAGIAYELQKNKIRKGIEIFKCHGIKIDAFIAPSHSFDLNTIKVLKEENIKIISDGHVKYPYIEHDLLWIPCQIWDCMKAKRSGLYTVCYHPNTWTPKEYEKFEIDVKKQISNIISPFEISNVVKLSVLGKVMTKYVALKFKFKRFIKKILGRK